MRAAWIGAGLLLHLVVAAAGVLALRESRELSFPVVQGPTEECPWMRLPDRACVQQIGDVRLDRTSLVREPGYLDGDQSARWLGQQRRFTATMSEPAVSVVIDGRPTSVETQPAGLPTTRLLVALAIGLLIGATGAFVLWKRPKEEAARALFLACQGLVISLLPTVVNESRGIALDPTLERFLYFANMVGLVVAALGAVRLVAVYPRVVLGSRTDLLTRTMPGALGAAALIVELASGLHAAVASVLLLAVEVLALFVLGQRIKRTHQERVQSRWLLWGAALPIIVFVVTRLPYHLGWIQGDPDDSTLFILTATLPIGAAVGILRHGMLDIDVVIRRTIVGALAAPVILFGYALAVSAFAGGLTHQVFDSSILATAIILTLLLLPLQARLEGWVDRLFFRNRHDYRAALASVPEALATVSRSEDAARLVLEQLRRVLEIDRAVVALPGGATWSLGGAAGPDEERTWAPLRSGGAHLSGDGEPVDGWLANQGLVLALPLRTSEAFVGVLALSGKPLRRLYSAEDVAMLRGVGAGLALALSRAFAFETIEAMNADLEQKITARTQELEGVRLRLFQWEKMAALGVLSAGVAHELNTPLGVVISTADQLHRRLPAGTPEARLAELAHDAARRGAEIVADLARFSRPQDQARQPVDLHEGLDTTLRILGRLIADQDIRVVQYRTPQPMVLEGYPATLHQTFVNLVQNAAQSLPRGGCITLTTERDDTQLRVIIADDGPGIPPELRERIFEPFFTTRAAGEGTGLGLSLCYTFVTEHGGSIREEGAPGRGARFVVELPVALPPAP